MYNVLARPHAPVLSSRAMSSRPRLRVSLAVALTASALVTAPSRARAQAIVFGGNLARPVNYRFDCGVGPGIGPFGEQIAYPTNVTTCTWMAIGTNFGQQESLLVPSGIGTITQVRLKVGQITGPMQVTILRAARQPDTTSTPDVVCCTEVARSNTFTPAPSAISTIALNLPVRADIVPNPISGFVEFDAVTLTVLAPGVPIPAHDTGVYENIAGPSALIYFPHIRPSEERFISGWGAGGYQLLMEATWVPVQTGGGGGGVVTVVQPVATRAQNNLLLGLRCNQATPCIGTLLVQNQGVIGGGVVTQGAGKRARVITYAKGSFNIAPEQSLQLPAKLKRKGKRALKKSPRPTLHANFKIGDTTISGGTITVPEL